MEKDDEMMNDENDFDTPTLHIVINLFMSAFFSRKMAEKCKITDTKQKNVHQKIYLFKKNSASDPLVHPCPPLCSPWH